MRSMWELRLTAPTPIGFVGIAARPLFFAVTVVERGDTPWGGGVAGTLFGHELAVDENGEFELFLSPEPQPGNWICTTPETFRVTVRQFFLDWEGEGPMRARIDRLTGDSVPSTLTPEKVSEGLGRAARWVEESITYWADRIDLWKEQPNSFLSYRQLDKNPIDATPGGEPLISYWQLPKDEALIVRVVPPKADYWAVEFGNYWWETMDYRYRLASTNAHHAQLETDGELILVVSHDDPGVPNWLDPSGHTEGYITFRWVGADAYPVPQCQQVARAQLFRQSPNDCCSNQPSGEARAIGVPAPWSGPTLSVLVAEGAMGARPRRVLGFASRCDRLP